MKNKILRLKNQNSKAFKTAIKKFKIFFSIKKNCFI